MAKDSSGNRSAHANNSTDSGFRQRGIISQQAVKRTLLASKEFTRPDVKPLAARLVSQKSTSLTEALKPLKQGVTYASDLIHQLKSADPADQRETIQNSSRIKDTIHLLEGLHKALEKETNGLLAMYNQAEDKTPENHALYLESSALLNTLESHIQTLEKMDIQHS